MAADVGVQKTSQISANLEGVVAPQTRVARHRLRRGRTRLLAIGDLVSLVVAYALAYVVADSIAPLPPVSADRWFLALVAVTAPVVWLGLFTAYRLYDNDSLRISVSSFDEVRDLLHAMLVGSLIYLVVSQAVDSSSTGGSTPRSSPHCSWPARWCSSRSFAARSGAGCSRV